MLHNSIFSIETAVVKQDGAMEAETITKNGASPKSQMSRRNLFQFVFLSIVAILVFSSCGKDKDTTYTLKYSVEDVSGVVVDIITYEYSDTGEVVGQKSFDKCVNGFSKTVSANPKATKVKVKVTMKASSKSLTVWVKQVFYIENGKNVDIEMKGSTTMVEKEP